MVTMTKKSAVVSIVIWSCVAVLLSAILIIFCVKNFTYDKILDNVFEKGTLHTVYTCDKSSSEFNSVEIDWHVGSVNVTQSSDDQMHLTQTSYYNVDELECTVSGGTLIIRQKDNYAFFFIGFCDKSSDLELSLPKKQYEQYTLNMTSGTTTCNDISAKTIELKMTSGVLEANSLKADSLTTSVTSGKMTVKSAEADSLSSNTTSGQITVAGSFGSIKSQATSGTITIESDLVPQTLAINITSGKISVAIPDNDGFTLNCKKTSGDFDSSFDLYSKENTYYYLSGGTAERQYSVKLTSGTFELLKQ